MNNTLTAGAALLLTTTQLSALGLDRTGQHIGVIFENGSYAELSFGYVMSEVSGQDVATFGSSPTGNVAEDHGVLGMGYKRDINSEMSFAIIVDEPYGADVSFQTGRSVAFGGSEAVLNSFAVTSLLRYKLDDNISFHVGLRAQSIDANVTLDGAAYGGLAGYNVDLARDTQFGYIVGAAYEVPESALRVALTYISEIVHEFGTTDTFGSTEDTKVTTPQAVNLDFQIGIAADTLLFGSVRWAEYSVVLVEPENYPAGSLTDIDNGYAYTLGVGRQFSDQFSGTLSVGYEPEGADLVSPTLPFPSNGSVSLALGGKYTVGNMEYSGGVRYAKLGDASAQTADTPRADFNDNDALAVEFRVGYRF